MNLSQLLTTLVVVASSATGLVFADELGFDPMEPKTGRHAHDDPCAAEGEEEPAEEESGNETADDNSTEPSDNETASSGSSSSSGSESNSTTSSGNSTTSDNQTSTSSSTTTTSANSTDDGEETDEEAHEHERCDEDPAGNETAEDGNETAEPEEDTAEPESAPAAPPAPDCADVHIQESGDDLLGEDRDWSWLVAPTARHLSVSFEGSHGLGLGGSPDVTLVDGSGRVIASGDSGDGWGGLSVELFGPMTPGLWRLSYESEGLLSGYWLTVDLSC